MGQIRFNLNHGDVCMSLQLRIDSDASLMNNVDVHIHFPEGAISKVSFIYYVSTFRGKGDPKISCYIRGGGWCQKTLFLIN